MQLSMRENFMWFFLGKVFFLLWKTEEFIKLVDLESTRILEVDENVTSP